MDNPEKILHNMLTVAYQARSYMFSKPSLHIHDIT